MRSGVITLNEVFLRFAQYNAYIWSSSSADNAWGKPGLGAYNLDFNDSVVYLSHEPHSHCNGFPVRYLASGG